MEASPDGTHPDDMEEGVSETKDDKNENVYEEQYEKYPDVPSPVDMEEGDEKYDNTERLDEKKEAKGPGVTPTSIWRGYKIKVKNPFPKTR